MVLRFNIPRVEIRRRHSEPIFRKVCIPAAAFRDTSAKQATKPIIAKHAAPTQRRRKTGSFDLPFKIRKRIYRSVLKYEFPLVVKTNGYAHYSRICEENGRIEARPPLLTVCKLINDEALPIFFSSNAFLLSVLLIDGLYRDHDAKYSLIPDARGLSSVSGTTCMSVLCIMNVPLTQVQSTG